MSEIDVALKYRELCAIVNELETAYPERKFTIDGHLIGSIGEILAAEYYGLTLLTMSAEKHDAISADGRLVQIKATQIGKVSLSSEPHNLIVIKVSPTGDWEEIYNGPGEPVWENAGKPQKNGQRPISLKKLKQLMEQIPDSDRIRKKKEVI